MFYNLCRRNKTITALQAKASGLFPLSAALYILDCRSVNISAETDQIAALQLSGDAAMKGWEWSTISQSDYFPWLHPRAIPSAQPHAGWDHSTCGAVTGPQNTAALI